MDKWGRIEFQSRGSPHLHMLIWVENHPSLETPEGLKVVDKVITCRMPPADSPLHKLVKDCQIHQHRPTCHKNGNIRCRFRFPRLPNTKTHLVKMGSQEFLRNGGRDCILERASGSEWVNNYNETLLELWKASMDVERFGHQMVLFGIENCCDFVNPQYSENFRLFCESEV